MIDITRIKQRAKYIRPLLVPLILYIGFLALAVSWAPQLEPTPWGYILALLPIIPGVFIALGVVRVSTKIDEMERRILLEAVTFSFILTLIWLLSMGLLGLVGVPQPRSIHIVAVMCFLIIIGKLWGNWRYR
jgi:hypothetical protein